MTEKNLLQVPKNFELVQLIELARHGSRAPFYDLWDFHTNWKMPLKTLTDTGMRQHYLIGQELRSRYGDTIFNGNKYNSSEIKVVTSSSERAMQSAICQVYGIYQKSGEDVNPKWIFQAQTDLPPMQVSNGQQILEQLKGQNLPNSYQPINILVENDKRILESCDVCQGYDELKAHNFKTEVYYKFDASLAEFKKDFVEKFNLNIPPEAVTIKLISDHWDSVICDIYQQIPLPENFTKEFIQKLNFVYDFQQLYLNFNSDTGQLLKLQTTAFFQNLIGVIQNSTSTKFQLYCASDGNLNSVLVSFGYSSYTTDFQEWLTPTSSVSHSNVPFSSTIFFEIYRDKETQKKWIRTLYNDKIVNIQGCPSSFCSFEDEFIPSLTKNGILPEDEYNYLCLLQ